ncbi:MAG: tyrosine-type recombinase/integrase [Fusobacteriaceae bacterium]
MKNSNGTGCVSKMKDKRRKPWIARVTESYEDGKQKRKLIGTFSSKTEAQEALINYFKNPMLFSKKTFKEIVDLWWDTYTRRVTHKTTINTHIYRLKAFESLHNKAISEIKLFELQKMFDSMTTSWSFKSGCKSVLNMIFDYAFKNEFIDSNKVKFIEIGKREKVIDRKIFTKEEIETLWGNLDSKYVYIVLILIYTGMRIGELQNLKNEDIDFDNNTVQVKVSKTASGIRIIPISSRIINLFKDNYNIYQEYFVKGDSTLQLSYPTFKGRFNKLLKDLEIQPHTIHDTRHTFATLLNNANANHSSITKLIGHSDFNMTESVYTHKDTEELRKAVELLC